MKRKLFLIPLITLALVMTATVTLASATAIDKVPVDAPAASLDQWTHDHSGTIMAPAADVLGTKKVVVLRVYFKDRTKTSRYSKTQVEGFFKELDKLWRNTSYNKINLKYQVSDLFQLPDNRSAYIDDGDGPGNGGDGVEGTPCDPSSWGDLSCGNKFLKALNDAIDKSPNGLDWKDIDAVMVLMAETNTNQFHRGQGTSSCSVKMGPKGKTKNVGCAIFSENPSDTDRQNWGRWAHEIGHAFQQGGPAHPSNYNSEFELMDSNMPGQTGVFEKQSHAGFPGWLPATKYQTFKPAGGGGVANIWAMEYDPSGRPNAQAVKAEITKNLYYLISVRRRVRGDELNPDFTPNGIPDEGVLIERVSEGSNPWVTVKGKGGNRNQLWKQGDVYHGGKDGIHIHVLSKIDNDNYSVLVRYNDKANQPDVMLNPWTSPPGNTWETTDIWVDSPVNGYGKYRYGMWKDSAGNQVPRGNGDDPVVGKVNRLYARVRNIGSAPATDVVVTWEITDPPGVGIAGANGWKAIGSVTKTDFPGLANIAAGKFVDVYIEWKPSFSVSQKNLKAGRFTFHTCVRVKLNHVSGETVFGNQDGDREQENISYFQAVPPSKGESQYRDVIRLRNDDLVNDKFFNLSYKSDLPDAWILDVNGGIMGVELGPGEVREIPVIIEPRGEAVVGSVFGVDVSASSMRTLVNDLDPDDRHPEYKPLGGVRVEARVLQPTELVCEAERRGPGEILVRGRLDGINGYYDEQDPLVVAIEGVDGNREFLSGTLQVVTVAPDGSFEGYLSPDGGSNPHEVVCLFAGTTELASASSGYVPIAGPQRPAPTESAAPVLVYGGGALDNPAVQEAILSAVDWTNLSRQIFAEQDIPIVVAPWGEGQRLEDAREVPYDPDRARELLAEAGFPDGFRLLWLLSPEDEPLAEMTWMGAEALADIGVYADVVEVPASEAHDVMTELVTAGEPAIWMSRRSPSRACVGFEDPLLGTVYHVGDVFADSGTQIYVRPYQWNNGQWTTAGFAEVDNAGLA